MYIEYSQVHYTCIKDDNLVTKVHKLKTHHNSLVHYDKDNNTKEC